METHSDAYWMAKALAMARHAQAQDEVPVGAVVVQDNQLLAEGWNQPITSHDPTAHAEIIALRAAAKVLKNYRVLNTTLYVTLEPCAMCIGAILHARVSRLVFGANDPRAGAIQSVFKIANEPRLNHRIDWQGGIMAEECGDILRSFFRNRR